MKTIIEHIRSQSPAHAAFYRLVGKLPSGENGLFPKDGNAFYAIGQPPSGTYPGAYQVFYFDSTGKQILHLRVDLQITEADGAELNSAAAGPQAMPVGPQHSASTQLAKPNIQRLELTKEQLEHRMSLDKDEQDKAFIENSDYVREVGENFIINRMMRRELIEMHKVIQEQKNTAYSDIEKQAAAIRTIGQLQKEVIASAAMIPRPAPPKPDLTPLGQDLIELVRSVGMALIEKRSANPAQLPNKPESIASSVPSAGKPETLSAPAKYSPVQLAEPAKEKQSPINWSLIKEQPESD